MFTLSARKVKLLLLAPVLTMAQDKPEQLRGVEITEKLGAQVDLSLTFVEDGGRPAALRQYFNRHRPVILNLIYYNCPMLCSLILNGQTAALRELPGTPGKEFEVLTISIDPRESPELAREKKRLYLERYGKPAPGWHFLTDHEGNVKRLAEQVGFGYRFDERTGQYAHAAATVVLTPEGKVSRYLYGIKYKQRDLRLALAEAGLGKSGLSFERLLLYCFHYDPQAKSYVVFAARVMKAGGALVLAALAIDLWRLWVGERRRALALRGAR